MRDANADRDPSRCSVRFRVLMLSAVSLAACEAAPAASRAPTLAAVPSPAPATADRVHGQFFEDGAWVSNPTSSARLSLAAYGCPGRALPVAAAVRSERAGRVEYRRAGISEWYERGARGVEQSFSLEDAHCTAQNVELDVAVEGLTPRPAASANGVDLSDERGVVRMHYTDLSARDALGKTLPATMSVVGGRIALRVATEGAAYPIVVDPEVWSAATPLIGDESASSDQFGLSLSISADTVVVGAPNETVAGKVGVGALFVFLRSGTVWSQQGPALTPTLGAPGDRVGCSVSLSADTALVGASNTFVGGNPAQGAAYVFVRSGTTWQQQGAALTSSDATAGDGFGISVSVSGDTALVGASSKSLNAGTALGAAYVFLRSGTTWQQQGTALIAADAGPADSFGYSVSVSGDTALVGAPFKAGAVNAAQGAAYAFVRAAGVWQQQGPALALADAAPNDWFGYSVSVSGDTALVGAAGRGAAYVFVRSGTTWSQQGPGLPAVGLSSASQFGDAVSLEGDTAVVGAPGQTTGGLSQGAAYVFVRSAAVWTQQGPALVSPDAISSFGAGTAISGETALVGAANGSSDAAYAFDRGACTVDSGCCAQNSDCAVGGYCPAYGVCQPLSVQGAPCTDAKSCATAQCVDGVCCDTACSGSCEACSGTATGGPAGTCLPILDGQDPDQECAADPGYPTSCLADGTCDGQGACRADASVGTVCGDTACSGDSLSGALCDGAGSCVVNTKSCAPYQCNGAGCGTTCVTDADCAIGHCFSGVCATQKPPARPCTFAGDCVSGFCADGLCCDSACDGHCQSCAEPGTEGQCTLISGAPRDGHGACSGDPKVCGGTCDGTGTDCQYAPANQVCENACVSGQAFLGACDGAGSCRLQQDASLCGAYACGEAACLVSCASDTDCVNGAHCIETKCLTPKESLCSADLSMSILGDSTQVQCGTYTCEDATGACRSQCGGDTDCAPGNSCDSTHQCGPTPAVTPAKASDKSSASCGCHVGTLGDTRGAIVTALLLLGALRRRRKPLLKTAQIAG